MTAKRNKDWGREIENATLRALRGLWPKLARSGSIGYVAGHADLWIPGASPQDVLPLVVTKEKGQGNPLLVTLSLADFIVLASGAGHVGAPLVQVKGRSRPIYTHTVYKELTAWIRSRQVDTPT